MINLSQILKFTIGSNAGLLVIFSISILLRATLLFYLLKKTTISTSRKSWFFLCLVLVSAMVADSAWILHLLNKLSFPNLDPRLIIFHTRIAWAFTILQYHGMSLFIESIFKTEPLFGLRQKIFTVISTILFLIFCIIALVYFNVTQHEHRALEFFVQKIAIAYDLFIIMLPTLFISLRNLKLNSFPRILNKQLKILSAGVMIPIWISDLLQAFPFISHSIFLIDNKEFVGLSNILLTYGLFYCARKLVGLRFLNFQNHVQSRHDFNFMDDFKVILEQFSHVTDLKELGHIAQNFFKESLEIPLSKTRLYIRKKHTEDEQDVMITLLPGEQVTSLVETFMNTHSIDVCKFIQHYKILIYDEIAFSNFYDQTPEREAILHFMDAVDADVFLPIYEKQRLIAYIIIERSSRRNAFYSNVERDQMLVFASYLGNIINLIQNKNLDTLVQQEKKLREELYKKHQEINQYKESIRSFIRTGKQKEIGILLYKHRRFTFANQTAKEILRINPNSQEGHPVTKKLKDLAQAVENYNRQQTVFAQDNDGKAIILSAVPDLDQRNVIVTVYYPDMSDILRRHLDLLKDPSEWDYLLYLETTQSGKLINHLIPGSGEKLLAFKIDLLKLALSKKPILLDMPIEDLDPIVELLHHISLRDQLHVLRLTEKSNSIDIAVRLFGINPIFGMKDEKKPLFESLSDNGTIFIQNVHYLNKEVQEYLADYFKYGSYRLFKSDQRVQSSVRIICSTDRNLAQLVQDGAFNEDLFNELKQTALAMPSLITLPEAELSDLAEGLSEQALKTQAYKNLLELTPRDKSKIITMRPASLHELKSKIHTLLVQKSKKNEIYHETYFDPAYQVSDPELIEAARLGKYALKDRKTMTLLWQKFRNQNKIATFLGVNRSSVNRRCREFNLAE